MPNLSYLTYLNIEPGTPRSLYYCKTEYEYLASAGYCTGIQCSGIGTCAVLYAEVTLGTLDHPGNARIAWFIDISEMVIFRLTEHPGAPPLKGPAPVVLLMGESSDITDFDIFSIEDYSATTRWILDLSSSK